MDILLKILKIYGIYFVVASVVFGIILAISYLVFSKDDEPLELTEEDIEYLKERNRRADHWNES